MNLLICGSFWHGSLEESYARAFERIGWRVVRFDWEQIARAHPLATMAFADKLLRQWIGDRVGKWLTAAIEDTRPDLVLVIKGSTISPETLTAAKRILSDRPLVNFNPDSPWDPSNRTKRLLESIPIYDVHFTWNAQLQSEFIKAGGKQVHYLPFAYDPVLHHPLTKGTEQPEYDAIFVGTYSPERDKLLGAITDCDIRIVGNGWARANDVPKHWVLSTAVYGEAALHMIEMGSCAINILRPQNHGSHNMRTFEIPATARPMLATRSPEQANWFADGTDASYFDDAEELSNKILGFKKDREFAETLARNGCERVREETYEKRARQMIAYLGFVGG
ncbi:MAG TPA: glycosyltransferase [Candidatus Kapabacteria bacterium]|nr:glycosyltransferase [Candidatus Kapabacteria bacterium]